jgi:predicted phage gp36 major capsid-like protein
VIKKEAKKILKYKDHTIEIQRMWNVEANGIPEIIWGDWNQFSITQTIPEQHTRKARN